MPHFDKSLFDNTDVVLITLDTDPEEQTLVRFGVWAGMIHGKWAVHFYWWWRPGEKLRRIA